MSINTIKGAQQLAQKTLFKELEHLCAALECPSHNTPYHLLDRKGRLELVQSIYATLALVESYSGGGGKVLPQDDTYSEGHVHYCAHPDCPGRTHEPPHDECHEGSVL
jgi:hypothetical protein